MTTGKEHDSEKTRRIAGITPFYAAVDSNREHPGRTGRAANLAIAPVERTEYPDIRSKIRVPSAVNTISLPDMGRMNGN